MIGDFYKLLRCPTISLLKYANRRGETCGGGGIRTPGTERFNGFRDRPIRPLWHTSMLNIAVCPTE